MEKLKISLDYDTAQRLYYKMLNDDEGKFSFDISIALKEFKIKKRDFFISFFGLPPFYFYRHGKRTKMYLEEIKNAVMDDSVKAKYAIGRKVKLLIQEKEYFKESQKEFDKFKAKIINVKGWVYDELTPSVVLTLFLKKKGGRK